MPDPFLVLATQNPIESEGVYPLPEAQRDRFLMKIVVGYPSPPKSSRSCSRMGDFAARGRRRCSRSNRSCGCRRRSTRCTCDRSVLDYAVNLVYALAPENFGRAELRSFIELGASPRASIGLIRGGRALALLRGRGSLTPQDVFDVAPEILRHRLLLSYEALAQDITVEHV